MLNRATISMDADKAERMRAKDLLVFDNVRQRKLVWNQKQKSELVHSMACGYPIPTVYAKRINDRVYDFLDGKQRINTICDFLNDKFKIVGIDMVPLDDLDEKTEMIDINGKRFSELPEIIKNRIRNYLIDVCYFDNITEQQAKTMFKKLNNGKSLSYVERNVANCNDLDNAIKIGEHPIFKKILTKSTLKSKKQVTLVMKTYIMLFNLDQAIFDGDKFKDFLEETIITEEQKAIIESVLDKMLEIMEILEKEKAKGTIDKLKTDCVFTSLIPLFKKAINDNVSSELLVTFLKETFNDTISCSDVFSFSCKQGGGHASSIKTRHEELFNAWNKFVSNTEIKETVKETKKETVEEENAEEENTIKKETADLVQHDSEASEEPTDEQVDKVSTDKEKADEEPKIETETKIEIDEVNNKEEEYKYGMKSRGFSPKCQPMTGFLRREDDETNWYYDIIVYDRELSQEEINQYDLDPIDNDDSLPFD